MAVLNQTADRPGFYSRQLQMATLRRCLAWMLKHAPQPDTWGMVGACPFYLRQQCLIYPMRPIVCRALAVQPPVALAPVPRLGMAAGFAAWYAKHLHTPLRRIPNLAAQHFHFTGAPSHR